MIDNEAKSASTEAPSAANDDAPDAREKSPWEGDAGDSAPDLTTVFERLESEKADLTDRLVRLAAEMDNLRKRTERDVADARKYAVSKFAADILVVGDNLRRTLAAVPAEVRETADDTLKTLVEGVEMTEREMDRLLEKNGIKRIAAIGERFDPNKHQAMFEVADPTVPPGTVVQVVQEGYQIGDRVLRAALVGVSKDAAKPQTVGEGSEPEERG
jgi:molecular chaperone GrpE